MVKDVLLISPFLMIGEVYRRWFW